jgi:hypothetical protein
VIEPSALREAKAYAVAWGRPDTGGTDAPDGNGYTKIYSNVYAFAALKADGSITAWGDSDWYSHYQRVRLRLHNPNHPMP